MEVAVLELDYHPEVLRDTCRILDGVASAINVLTTYGIWKKADTYPQGIPSNVRLALQQKGQIEAAFLAQYRPLVDEADVLLINTVASNYRLLARQNWRPKTILRIHNTHAFFGKGLPSYRPRWSRFYLWKDLSHLVRNTLGRMDWKYRKRLLQKIDYFAFPNAFMAGYAQQQYGVDPQRAIALPLSYASAPPAPPEGEPVTITVVGRVDPRVRDYELLAEAFRRALPQIRHSVELVLLGDSSSPYGRRMVGHWEALEGDNFSVRTFERFVPQETFQRYTRQTDFFVLPIKIETRYTIYREWYGYTKMSGAVNDMLKYGRPMLLSKAYPLPGDLQPMTATFEDARQLARQLVKWVNEQVYLSLPVNEALAGYQLPVVRQQYQQVLERVTGASAS